jgi:hypothetical protein
MYFWFNPLLPAHIHDITIEKDYWQTTSIEVCR